MDVAGSLDAMPSLATTCGKADDAARVPGCSRACRAGCGRRDRIGGGRSDRQRGEPEGSYTTYPNGAKKGEVYSCGPHDGGGGAQVNGPWIHGKTWDSTAKVSVEGSVHWKSVLKISVAGSRLKVSGNGLPSHPTGVFPIAANDPAYRYDRNPNSIQARSFSYALPATPKVAAKPSCIAGPIAVMLTGALLYDGLDAEGRDAPAH